MYDTENIKGVGAENVSPSEVRLSKMDNVVEGDLSCLRQPSS